MKWGKLRVETLAFELPEEAELAGTSIRVAGRTVEAETKQDGRRVTFIFPKPVAVKQDEPIEVEIAL